MSRHKENRQASDQDYRAFLLRCWREQEREDAGESGEAHIWRFTLIQLDSEKPNTGFVRLEDLMRFLADELRPAGEEPPEEAFARQ